METLLPGDSRRNGRRLKTCNFPTCNTWIRTFASSSRLGRLSYQRKGERHPRKRARKVFSVCLGIFFFFKKSGIWRTYLKLFQHRRLHRSELLKTPSAPCRDSSSSRRGRSVSRCRQRFPLARSLFQRWDTSGLSTPPRRRGPAQLQCSATSKSDARGRCVLIIRPWIFQNKKVWCEAERKMSVSKQR